MHSPLVMEESSLQDHEVIIRWATVGAPTLNWLPAHCRDHTATTMSSVGKLMVNIKCVPVKRDLVTERSSHHLWLLRY